MNPFQGKKVCIVMTCNLPRYIERIKSHKDTFTFLKDNNFIIVFLFGNSPTYDIKLDEIATNEYNLYVPIMECYEMLSPKMECAYRYFNEKGCKLILKLDDDVTITDKGIFITTIFNVIDRYDYGGYNTGTYGYSNLNSIDTPNLKINYLKKMFIHADEKITYYGGPFYWISALALKEICNIGMLYFHEDIAVGYAISHNKYLSVLENCEIIKQSIQVDDKSTNNI
jgi:hypothetical protein